MSMISRYKYYEIIMHRMLPNPEDLEKELQEQLEEIRRLKKKKKKPKILEDAEEIFEIDEESDRPVHERYTKERPVKRS